MNKIIIPLLLAVFLTGILFIFVAHSKKTGHTTKPIAPVKEEKKTVAVSLKAVEINEILKKTDSLINSGEFDKAFSEISQIAESKENAEIDAQRGYIFTGMGDYENAQKSFEKSLALKKNPQILYALAKVLDAKNDIVKANEKFGELLKMPIPPGILKNVRLSFAKNAEMMNYSEKAYDTYILVLKDYPDVLEAYLGLFRLMKRSGDIHDLSMIRSKGDKYFSSDSFDYVYNLGLVYYENEELNEAQSCFKAAASIKPENSASFYFLYKIYRSTKKIEESVQELEKFYALNNCLPYIFFQAAIDAKNEKHLKTAFQFYSAAVLSDKTLLGQEDQGTLKEIEKYISKEASQEEKSYFEVFDLFINGDISGAEKALPNVISSTQDPNLKKGLEKIQYEISRKKDIDEAYNKYASERKAGQDAALGRLKVLLKDRKAMAGDLGKPENPLDVMKTKALQNPRDSRLQYTTALQLAKAGDIESAKIFFGETIRSNPTVFEPYYSLGKLAQSQGNMTEAIANLEQAVKVAPNNSQAKSFLASLYYESGNQDKAIQEALESLKANPCNGEARTVLAKSYLTKGDKEQALKEVNLAIQFSAASQKLEFESLKRKIAAENN
ncbi:MAG: tetratricopeptide repeat protein [Candidatus Riflebacteria bacterium]|nr:tetratricopeptide repeat protein [Candidatus Riflebacteria bacterium]